MTIINRAGQTAIPVVQVREVNADPLGRDRSWVEERQSQGATSYSVIPITIEEERTQEPSKRAAVWYFDLLKWGGLAGNSVEDVLEWVRHYRTALRSDEVPACLIAVGKTVVAKDRRRLAKAGIHYLNEERRRFQRLMGVGDRGHQIYRLIQNLSGNPIGPRDFPYAQAAIGGSVQLTSGPQPNPTTADAWDIYTSRPPHVDRADVEALFKKLMRKPQPWERDD